ncbi:hypothetical protein IAD21_05022 [Abditibacteriota bacterium]|nr:hypothetical protein IAD21_05022 [Abditibacteriota bacterium]
MNPIHVWPQEIQVADGFVTHSALIEDCEPFTLWFRVPAEHTGLLSSRAESFVAGVLLLAMMRGRPLRVHAPLSPSFLRNVEELQALWSCWDSGFHCIPIEAESESESTIQAPNRAISMFSGGVDSCYTVWRHTQNRCGRRALPLQTALMVHGSEIPLDRDDMFETALRRSQIMLSAVNVDLVRLATNFRHVMPYDYIDKWFGTMLAASLLLFQESHTTGLIPASFSYHGLVLPYASTPLNDPLFSTARFAIEHDGAIGSRAEKMKDIIEWPGVLENLRVCNNSSYAHINCGRCEKCVRNILTLRIVGVQAPPCFPNTLSNADIEHIRIGHTSLEAMKRVVIAAQKASIQDSWVNSVQKCIRTNERRARWNPLRQKIKSHTPPPLWSAGKALKNRLKKNS